MVQNRKSSPSTSPRSSWEVMATRLRMNERCLSLEARLSLRTDAPPGLGEQRFLLVPFALTCLILTSALLGFPGGSVVENPATNAGDMGLIPGSGRSTEKGNVNLLQYSCLENSVDRGAWWATAHRVTKSWTRLSDWAGTDSYSYLYILYCAHCTRSSSLFFTDC